MLFKNKNQNKNTPEIIDISYISKIEQKNIKRVFARAFSTDDGKKVLAYLQYITFNRHYGAEVSNEQLRYAEGQRAIVHTILRFIEQGKEN